MSDRVYKGKFQVQKSEAFSEASTDFDTPHAGGLNPFELMRGLFAGEHRVIPSADSVIITKAGVSVVISRDGVVEIITAGA